MACLFVKENLREEWAYIRAWISDTERDEEAVRGARAAEGLGSIDG